VPPPSSPSRSGRRGRGAGTWWPGCRAAARRRRCRPSARSWLWHCVESDASRPPADDRERERERGLTVFEKNHLRNGYIMNILKIRI